MIRGYTPSRLEPPTVAWCEQCDGPIYANQWDDIQPCRWCGAILCVYCMESDGLCNWCRECEEQEHCE